MVLVLTASLQNWCELRGDMDVPELPGSTEESARTQGIYRLPNLTIQVPAVPQGFLATILTFCCP